MRSLFGRTAFLLTALIVAFQLLIFSASWLWVLRPLLQTSVDELAGLLTLSAKTYSDLPGARRPDYLASLRREHRLEVEPASAALSGEHSLLPYLNLLEARLAARHGIPVKVVVEPTTPPLYTLDLPAGAETLRFRFTHDRIGTQPGLVFLVVVLGSISLGILAALLVARGLTRPLAQLAAATMRIGRREDFMPLPETGARELASLAREFNRMARHVRELVDNRTTLLAGVSHDLRSPMARLRLAIELCQQAPTAQLYARMENDLEAMNALIGEFLDFSRGVTQIEEEDTDLVALLNTLAESVRRPQIVVECKLPGKCTWHLSAHGLRRIVINLLDNAVRYGGGFVDLVLREMPDGTIIEVRDRGPGIPPERYADVFRPFVRLESSRNARTGGSGLGLAIVRQIADVHGWTVTLSARDGGGLVARLFLPVPIAPT